VTRLGGGGPKNRSTAAGRGKKFSENYCFAKYSGGIWSGRNLRTFRNYLPPIFNISVQGADRVMESVSTGLKLPGRGANHNSVLNAWS
jgi:hypothetical protein